MGSNISGRYWGTTAVERIRRSIHSSEHDIFPQGENGRMNVDGFAKNHSPALDGPAR